MSDQELSQGDNPSAAGQTSVAAGAGSILRAAREAQGLHIAMLAVSLKVPVKKLEALEANRFDLLPDMVFVRALASSICRNLKIDEQSVLSALPRSEVPKMGGIADGVRPRFQDAGQAKHGGLRKNFRSPWGLALLLVLAAIAAIVFWPKVATPVDAVGAVSSAPSTTATVIQALTNTPGAEPPMPLQAAPSPTASAGVGIGPLGAASGAQPAASEVKALPDTMVAGPLKLVANGSSWIEVLDADGAVVFRRTLAQGESTLVGGKLPLSVVLGRADLVSVWVRDQAFDTSTYSKDSVARFQVK